MTFALEKIDSFFKKLLREDITDILCEVDLMTFEKEFCLTVSRSTKKLETDTLPMI